MCPQMGEAPEDHSGPELQAAAVSVSLTLTSDPGRPIRDMLDFAPKDLKLALADCPSAGHGPTCPGMSMIDR